MSTRESLRHGVVDDLSPAGAPDGGSARAAHAAEMSAQAPGSQKPKRSFPRRLVVVGVVLIAAFGFLIVKGLSGSLNYFETVDQALSHRAMLGTQTFRLEGLVVPGTVHRTKDGVSFVAAGTHHRIEVTNTTNPPQLFQPDIPVVVVGHFSGSTFVSNQIIVDHTAQYIEEYPKRVEAPDGTRR